MGAGRCSQAVVREGLTGWVGGGANMLGCRRGSHAGVGRCSHAGVGKGITGWSGLSLIYDEVIKRNLP